MRDYLLQGALRGAVNVPALGAKELHVLQPYITLAESLGRFQAQLVDSAVREVRLEFAGEIVDLDAAPVTRSFLAGLLRDVSTAGMFFYAKITPEIGSELRVLVHPSAADCGVTICCKC